MGPPARPRPRPRPHRCSLPAPGPFRAGLHTPTPPPTAGRPAPAPRAHARPCCCAWQAASAMTVPHGAPVHGEPRARTETAAGAGPQQQARRGAEARAGPATRGLAACSATRACDAGSRRPCRGASSRPSGAGAGAQRRCRAAGAVGLLLLMFPLHAWAAPARLAPFNAPAKGGSTITVLGLTAGNNLNEFGTALSYPKVRIGGTAARSTNWISATSIIATLDKGNVRPAPR